MYIYLHLCIGSNIYMWKFFVLWRPVSYIIMINLTLVYKIVCIYIYILCAQCEKLISYIHVTHYMFLSMYIYIYTCTWITMSIQPWWVLARWKTNANNFGVGLRLCRAQLRRTYKLQTSFLTILAIVHYTRGYIYIYLNSSNSTDAIY